MNPKCLLPNFWGSFYAYILVKNCIIVNINVCLIKFVFWMAMLIFCERGFLSDKEKFIN